MNFHVVFNFDVTWGWDFSIKENFYFKWEISESASAYVIMDIIKFLNRQLTLLIVTIKKEQSIIPPGLFGLDTVKVLQEWFSSYFPLVSEPWYRENEVLNLFPVRSCSFHLKNRVCTRIKFLCKCNHCTTLSWQLYD